MTSFHYTCNGVWRHTICWEGHSKFASGKWTWPTQQSAWLEKQLCKGDTLTFHLQWTIKWTIISQQQLLIYSSPWPRMHYLCPWASDAKTWLPSSWPVGSEPCFMGTQFSLLPCTMLQLFQGWLALYGAISWDSHQHNQFMSVIRREYHFGALQTFVHVSIHSIFPAGSLPAWCVNTKIIMRYIFCAPAKLEINRLDKVSSWHNIALMWWYDAPS